MTISFNPIGTTNGAGSFNQTGSTYGYVQGTFSADPAVRNQLAGGIIAASETLPMWGGLPIYENLAGPSDGRTLPAESLGNTMGRATTLAQMVGFSVFDQAHSWIQTPGSEVPAGSPGQTCNFFRFGSRARIAVKMDSALVALVGSSVNQQLTWDWTGMQLAPYAPAEAQEAISSITWAAGVASVTTAAAHGYLVGDDVTISGAVPAGYNGDMKILTVPSATTFTYALVANPGTTPATTAGVILAGGGALPVRLIGVNVGNSKTVTYDAINNLVHWSPTGSCGLIEI